MQPRDGRPWKARNSMDEYTIQRGHDATCHMLSDGDLTFWTRWLDEYTDEQIRAIDREHAHDEDEIASFGLSALPRLEQARIMRVLELHLTGRATVDRWAPGAYSLKHDAERFIQLEEGRPYYVSRLQAATVMRILGYRHDGEGRYNVSMKSYNRLRERISAMRCE